MNASLNNAGLELIKEELIMSDLIESDLIMSELITEEPAPVSAPASRTPSQTGTSGREALQALLAFSALHEQIRTRRAKQMLDGGRLSTHDDWQLEQFVLDEVLQLVTERALAITGADGVAIALAGGDAIVCRASAGSNGPDAGGRLDPNLEFFGEW